VGRKKRPKVQRENLKERVCPIASLSNWERGKAQISKGLGSGKARSQEDGNLTFAGGRSRKKRQWNSFSTKTRSIQKIQPSAALCEEKLGKPLPSKKTQSKGKRPSIAHLAKGEAMIRGEKILWEGFDVRGGHPINKHKHWKKRTRGLGISSSPGGESPKKKKAKRGVGKAILDEPYDAFPSPRAQKIKRG